MIGFSKPSMFHTKQNALLFNLQELFKVAEIYGEARKLQLYCWTWQTTEVFTSWNRWPGYQWGECNANTRYSEQPYPFDLHDTLTSWICCLHCSRSFWYSHSLGLLAPVSYGMITYFQEPLEIGRRGVVWIHLNWYTLAVVNEHLRLLKESVTYERDVDVGGPATVIS
jgi:hypothetical protein